jgi:hypothetical protein
MRRSLGLLVLCILSACGGGKSAGRPSADTTTMVSSTPPAAALDSTLRIIVTNDPRVYADGRAVTPLGLDSLLTTLRGINGEVWFYRETADPAVAARQDSLVDAVLAAITRLGLPLVVSRKPDFSDQVGKHRQRPTISPE